MVCAYRSSRARRSARAVSSGGFGADDSDIWRPLDMCSKQGRRRLGGLADQEVRNARSLQLVEHVVGAGGLAEGAEPEPISGLVLLQYHPVANGAGRPLVAVPLGRYRDHVC